MQTTGPKRLVSAVTSHAGMALPEEIMNSNGPGFGRGLASSSSLRMRRKMAADTRPLTPYLSNCSSALFGSNWRCVTRVAPVTIAMMTLAQPHAWNMDADWWMTMLRRHGMRSVTAPRVAGVFGSLRRTPFGMPVVPEDMMMMRPCSGFSSSSEVPSASMRSCMNR